MEKKRRILVTGSTGFVGTNLIPELLSSGFDLVLPVRDAMRCPKALRENCRVTILDAKELDCVERIDEALVGVFGIVHLAGLAHVGKLSDPHAFSHVNAGLTERLTASVKRVGGISLFVHMSSLAAITDNTSIRTIDDTTAPKPTTEYGISKLEAEAYTAELSSHGVCAISLRPPLIVGSGAKGNWANLQRIAATGLPLPFGSIHNRRSLVSIWTVVHAIIHLCCNPSTAEKSGNYCLADSGALSLISVLTELRAGFGMNPRLFPFPAPALEAIGRVTGRGRLMASLLDDLVVDASRFCSIFKFQAPISLREAIRMSGADYLLQRGFSSIESSERIL